MPKPYRITVAVLAGLAILMFAYPCYRIGFETEIDYNEGWNSFMQLRAMGGASPYSRDFPMFFNNYPPLSFYLVGLLGAVIDDPTTAGRLLSLLAVAAITASSAMVTRAAGGGRTDAALGAATCLGLFSAFATDYVGVNDPQLLAQAFLCLGFAIYVGTPATPVRLGMVAALFALGLLTKHNVLVLPLVVSLHALWRARGAARITYFATGIALAALAGLAIHLLYGPDFFRLLLAPRTYDVGRGFLMAMEVFGHLQSALAAVGLFLLLARKEDTVTTLVAAYLLGSLVLGCLLAGGAGVDINIFFDTMIALAMGTGLAAKRLRQQTGLPAGAPTLLALVANAGVILFSPEALGRFGVDALGELDQRQALFREDLAYLKGIPGPAICESMLLCLKSGRPVWFDPYNTLQATLTGRLDPDQVLGLLRDHAVAVVQVSSTREHPVDQAPGAQAMPPRFVNMGDPVFDELDRSYRLDRVGLSGRFYRPR